MEFAAKKEKELKTLWQILVRTLECVAYHQALNFQSDTTFLFTPLLLLNAQDS